MPSFLNKVFGYKKNDDREVARPSRDTPDTVGLLDGKYEAIPMLSPTDASFADAQQTRDSDRDTGFSLFKHKPRGFSHKSAHKSPVAVPHLTLRLPGPKENADARALGAVFDADPASQSVLDDAVIAAKRLSPLEALDLIRACAHTISERGLETLGIMHPHWFSASPDVQRKLISLFIRSLTPSTTLSSAPSAAVSAFENELRYTRSPHDVAAVLRWGLRHLTLENAHFAKDSAEWAWYTSFFQAERDASYPPKAFSTLLLPHLPASHAELLTVTLDVISSLAAHAETTGISGSKLSKFLGVWLLVASQAEASDDWHRFYARWERAGRILEHLFLAHLREESIGLRLPTRLQELVQHYPFNKGSPLTEDGLLPRPRFSTRQHDALCIRVETILTHGSQQPRQHPIQLLLEAFRLPVGGSSGDEHIALWNALKTTVFEDVASSNPQFTRIFVDETIQLLSVIPTPNNAPSPTLLTSPVTKVITRKRSSSLSKVLERALARSNGSTPASPTSPTSPVITDWAQFSLSGFGDAPSTQPLAVLYSDEDVEVTLPRQVPRKPERQRGKSRSRRRRSEEREPSSASLQHDEASIVETRVASVHVVHIDEAFIDFWSDAVVDPISAHWPTFVLCGLKELPSIPFRWLVVEQTYTHQESPRSPSPDGRRGRSPRPSFRSDMSGFRINSVLSSARKRFSVFSKSTSDLDPKKSRPVAGELGEVLMEEDVPNKDLRMDGKATISSGTTADTAEQVKANEICAMPIAVAPVDPVKEVGVAAEVPSIELGPWSGARPNGQVAHPLGTADKADARTSDPEPTLAPILQDVVEAKPVSRPDAHLPDPSNVVQAGIANESRAVAETVAISVPIIAAVANPIPPTAAVVPESPGVSSQPRADQQPSRELTVNVTTSAAEAVRYDKPSAADAQDRVSTEMPAQLQDVVVFADNVAEVEIHTPAREGALVEETPGQEVDVDGDGRAQGQSEVLQDDDAVPEPSAVEPVLEVEATSVLAVEEASGGIVQGEEGAQDAPEHAADHVSKCALEEATIIDPAPEEAPAAQPVQDAPPANVWTPVVETAALVDETPGPETATEENAPVQLPVVAPKPADADAAEEAQTHFAAAPPPQILAVVLPEISTARDPEPDRVQDREAARAAARLPLQEEEDEEAEMAVAPVDVPVWVASSVGDPVFRVDDVDGSVVDARGGVDPGASTPETVGAESVVEVGVPVPVVTEEASAAEKVVLETDGGVQVQQQGVDVAAEQLVASTHAPAVFSEEMDTEL